MEKLICEFRERGEDVPLAVKEEIVLAHLPLIRYIVNRIGVRLPAHIDLNDLYNTGVIGLLDAIDKYDGKKNATLKTYAEFRIKGAILDELRSQDWTPRSIRVKQKKLDQAYREVEQRLSRTARHEEVADALGIPIQAFHDLVNQTLGVSLINIEEMRGKGKNGEAVGSSHEIIEDVRAVNPFKVLLNNEITEAVKAAIATLPKSEKAVISLYFYSGLNENTIGAVLGVTESRIAQIITSALKRLEKNRGLQKFVD